MADKYKEYLATHVLNDSQIVTYRALSRALKVHVNLAKQMLYDFHQKQNAKKPGSVHATYLLTGKKRPKSSQYTNGASPQDGANSFMQSAPFTSSIPEPEEATEEVIPVTSIILVKEEDLEEVKTQLEGMTSIHIYSLEPGPLENIHLLSVGNQEIARKYAHEDPLENWKIYGTIHNPNITRRATRVPPPPVASVVPATTSKVTPRPNNTAQTKEKDAGLPKARRGSESEGSRSSQSTPQAEPTTGAKKLGAKPALKRDSSDIFKSFAKAKAKPKEATPATDSAEQSAQEDEPMKDVSEDEYEEDYTPEVEISKEKSDAARKARAEREEKLRQMMEDDDVSMDDAPAETEEEPTSTPLDKQPQPQEISEPEAAVTVTGGRRRGRRRVTKKKTVKDEEGYLVTKEEQVWESFSEDEPEPKKLKAPSMTNTTSKRKKGAKPGQGNITSFFTKK